VRYGALPQAAGLLAGVAPVVMAVVLQALWGLGRTAVKSAPLAVLGVAATVAAALGVHELLVLAGAATLMAAARLLGARGATPALVPALGPALGPAFGPAFGPALQSRGAASAAVGAAAGAATAGTVPAGGVAGSVGLWPLFGVFAKVGSVLFGSGYVLLAFLRADLVERLGWLTERQLLDAIAVGQVTPGPVFTTATFVGYVLAGPAGAAVATVGIFLPAFVFVALSGPLVPRLRRSPLAGAVLDGVNVASLALMAVVTAQLARSALTGAATLALAVASAVLLLRWRVNSAWLVLGGALVGLLAMS
jgi:chromate transporter